MWPICWYEIKAFSKLIDSAEELNYLVVHSHRMRPVDWDLDWDSRLVADSPLVAVDNHLVVENHLVMESRLVADIHLVAADSHHHLDIDPENGNSNVSESGIFPKLKFI